MTNDYRLEELDLVVAAERHDGLLPRREMAHRLPEPPALALAHLRADGFHLHVEQFLDRRLDLGLGGERVDLERVRVVPRTLVRALLGDERPQNHLVRLQLEPRLAVNARLAEGQLPHVLLRVWSCPRHDRLSRSPANV